MAAAASGGKTEAETDVQVVPILRVAFQPKRSGRAWRATTRRGANLAGAVGTAEGCRKGARVALTGGLVVQDEGTSVDGAVGKTGAEASQVLEDAVSLVDAIRAAARCAGCGAVDKTGAEVDQVLTLGKT